MLALIGEHIDAPIGATTWPLRVTATTHTAAGEIAVTIQRTSGSATADSGGTTDSLTRRGGHAEGEAHQHSGLLTWRVLLRPVAPMSALGQKATYARYVRFTPDNDRKSPCLPLPVKADMCGAMSNVCFRP